MNAIHTPLVPLWSKKSSSATPNFIPATVGLNTTNIKEARLARWIEAATANFVSAFAYQMSNDGNDWNTTPTAIGSYVGTTGWIYDTGASSAITTDQRLFVRFGFAVANGTGSALEQALGKLSIEIKPAEGGTLLADGVKVFSNGGTSDPSRIFHPLLGPVVLEGVGEHRPSLKLYFSSGLVQVKPAYQVSNDLLTWDDGEGGASNTFAEFGSARSSAGIDYGTTFTAFNPTNKKLYVRWGVAVNNVSGSVNEAGLVTLRMDYRRTT
jgi:hypothetical protein